jgi:hypothetical protein
MVPGPGELDLTEQLDAALVGRLRQRDEDADAVTRAALHPDAASMLPYQPLHQTQLEASLCLGRPIDALRGLKQATDLFRRDALSGVRHGDQAV